MAALEILSGRSLLVGGSDITSIFYRRGASPARYSFYGGSLKEYPG